MPQLMVAEWRPDMPDLASATNIAINVVPATEQSYGPFPLLQNWSSNVMDLPCLGAISIYEETFPVFFGTHDKLYKTVGFTTAIVDVSAIGTPYQVADGDNWRFAYYGGSVFATDYTDVIQAYDIVFSFNFAPLFTGTAWTPSTGYSTVGQQVIANGNRYTLVVAGTSAGSGGPSGTGVGIVDGTAQWNYESSPPPKAAFICTPKNFLMVGRTVDPVGGTGLARIWWSVSGDPTSWPAPGSEASIQGMSDFNDFEGNIGEVTGLVDSLANADVAILFRHGIWRGNFVGPPDVFDFFPIENARGCPASNSIVPYGPLVYFLGEDGFYKFDGAQSISIGVDKFDAWFWKTIKPNSLNMVIGAADVPAKSIMWAFPSGAAPSGLCDTILVYRWDIQRASYIDLADAPIEWLMRATNFFQRGNVAVGAVNNVNSFGFFFGNNNMAAQVATQTVQLTPGRRSYFQSARPLVDLTSGTPTVAVSGRVNLYHPEVFGPDVAPDVSGECPQRNDARYHDVLIKIPEGSTWTHIEGVDATFIGGGTR